MSRAIFLPIALLLLGWASSGMAQPLRLAVLGMPAEVLEEELQTTRKLEGGASQESGKEPPPLEGPSSNEAPRQEMKSEGDPVSEEPDKETVPQDMALFRILRQDRHEFFLSGLALPVYGNGQRLDPDLCLAVAWDQVAQWQSRLCYKALYAELQEQDKLNGELLGTFSTQRADGNLDLIDVIHEWRPGWMWGVGWGVSRHLLDFNRTGQMAELGGERFDSRTTLSLLSTGIHLGLYHRTDAGSALRFWAGIAPLARFQLDQAYFVGNDVTASATLTGSGGTIFSISASLTRRLNRRLEAMVDLYYRRLPLAYETRLRATTATGEVELVDRFRGMDSLLRSGARLTLHLPGASVSPYLEGAMYYTSNKDELDREYLYYSGWRLFLGISRFL